MFFQTSCWVRTFHPLTCRSKPLEFGMPLSPDEHNALISKLISVFESDMDELKRAGCDGIPKVTTEQLFQYRWVVQSWVQTVVHCARADLDETNYKTVEQAVLRGDALDVQLVNCLRSYPLEFGLTMLPDVRCLTAEGEIEEVEAENMIEQAEREEWRFDIDYQQLLFLIFGRHVQTVDSNESNLVFPLFPHCQPRNSKLQALQVKLTLDQKLLETISSGYGVLGDCLDWITTQKLALARQAKDVVSEHMKIYGPSMSVDGYETLPGDLQTLLGKLPPLADSGKRLFVYLLDFNVPNVSQMHYSSNFLTEIIQFHAVI